MPTLRGQFSWVGMIWSTKRNLGKVLRNLGKVLRKLLTMRVSCAICLVGRSVQGCLCAISGNSQFAKDSNVERCQRLLTHPDASRSAFCQLVHNKTCLHKAFYVMSDSFVSLRLIGQRPNWKVEPTNESEGERWRACCVAARRPPKVLESSDPRIFQLSVYAHATRFRLS